MPLARNASLRVNVYDAIVRSSNFITSYGPQLLSYSHNNRALGGYYSMQTEFIEKPSELVNWIQQGLGRHVIVKSQRLTTVWEGFVDEITVQIGALELNIGPFSQVRTRAKVVYSPLDTSINPPAAGARTSTAFDANDEATLKYGIQDIVESLPNATTAQTALQTRGKILDELSQPQTSRKSSLEPGDLKITLKCLGYWHWLDTYIFTQTTGGTLPIYDKMVSVLGLEPNAAIIFSGDYSHISNPTAEEVFRYDDDDRRALEVITELVGLGDVNSTRYIAGFYNDRVFYYQSIPESIDYVQKLLHIPELRDILAGQIDPYAIRAGKWLYYPDLNIGKQFPVTISQLRSDLRTGFIESVEYTAPYDLNIDGVKINTLDQFMARQGLKQSGT